MRKFLFLCLCLTGFCKAEVPLRDIKASDVCYNPYSNFSIVVGNSEINGRRIIVNSPDIFKKLASVGFKPGLTCKFSIGISSLVNTNGDNPFWKRVRIDIEERVKSHEFFSRAWESSYSYDSMDTDKNLKEFTIYEVDKLIDNFIRDWKDSHR